MKRKKELEIELKKIESTIELKFDNQIVGNMISKLKYVEQAIEEAFCENRPDFTMLKEIKGY